MSLGLGNAVRRINSSGVTPTTCSGNNLDHTSEILRVWGVPKMSTFRGNVRLIVQQKCPMPTPRWYQMRAAVAALWADSRRRCTSLLCACGFPVPSPLREWKGPSAWPVALPSTSPSGERSASPARRIPSFQPRHLRLWQGLRSLLRLSQRSAAQKSCPDLPVIRQNAPGVPRAQSHQCRRLIRRHVLSHQTVENLESRLFSGRQSHILHGVNVTFLLAS